MAEGCGLVRAFHMLHPPLQNCRESCIHMACKAEHGLRDLQEVPASELLSDSFIGAIK